MRSTLSVRQAGVEERATHDENGRRHHRWFAAQPGERFVWGQNATESERQHQQHRRQVDTDALGDEQDESDG